MLMINPVAMSDAGAYDCVVSNGCGAVTSTPAALAVTVRCPGDFNHSDGIEVQDIFDFLNAWFVACP